MSGAKSRLDFGAGPLIPVTNMLEPVTNMLQRLNCEVKRRTQVVGIFPNDEACLLLVRALAVEIHENWLEAHRYLNMNDLREDKKANLR